MDYEKPVNVTIDKSTLITLIDDKTKEKLDINVSYFLNKTIIQDLKSLLYYEINEKDEFIDRSVIVIKNKDFSKYKGKTITLLAEVDKYKKVKKKYIIDYNTTVNLGTFLVVGKNELNPDHNELFELIEEHNVNEYSGNVWNSYEGKETINNYSAKYFKEKDKDRIIDIYKNGMFKLYYKSLLYEAKNTNTLTVGGKISAMCSYLAIKEEFNRFFKDNKISLEISNPNVFIKNNNYSYECDALVVKKGSNNEDKYFFDYDEVEAIIEIKTAGIFFSKERLIKEDAFKKYIEDRIAEDKKYLFISLYESFGDREGSVHYYEYAMGKLLNIKNVYGIFCATKRNQDKYLIPYDYDLKEILKKIFK